MPLQTQTTRLGSLEIATTQFAAMRSLKLLTRLGRLFGPGIGTLAAALGEGGLEGLIKGNPQALQSAVLTMFAGLDDAEVESIAREVLAGSSVVVDGHIIALNSRETINLVFDGQLRALLSAMLFALKVNFADFFDERASAESASPGLAAVASR